MYRTFIEPIVVSNSIFDIIYNNLNLPSVIYDLFIILYILTIDDIWITDNNNTVETVLEYIPYSYVDPYKKTIIGNSHLYDMNTLGKIFFNKTKNR